MPCKDTACPYTIIDNALLFYTKISKNPIKTGFSIRYLVLFKCPSCLSFISVFLIRLLNVISI